MHVERSEIPDDQTLDDESRVAISALLSDPNPAVKLAAVQTVRKDFLARPENQVGALLIGNPTMFKELLGSIVRNPLPLDAPRVLEAEDCLTTFEASE
jgi:hypothetical protein